MTLAQVYATIASVILLMATWGGLIIAMALLLPQHTSRAELALTARPLRSFVVGLAMIIPTVVASVMLRSPFGGVKLLGFIALVAIGAALSIGASGMALLMGRRISEMSDSRSGFASMVRGSAVFSLALGFPVIGWFLFLPIALVISLGAGTRALWRSSQSVLPLNPAKPDYDVLEHRGAV
jgi:hypothetical protein